MCIEYDGEQHFRPVHRFGCEDNFKKTKRNDELKNTFCKNNNIKLLRISYKEKGKIRDIIEEVLNVK